MIFFGILDLLLKANPAKKTCVAGITNDKIVKTYADGRVVTDYALGSDYRVFFDVGDGDLIGIGRSWIRYPPAALTV